MKIVQVSMLYDEQVSTKEQLLESHYTLTGWAEALQRKGAELTVISRFREEGELIVNGVRYLFHQDKLKGLIRARQIPWSFLKRISKLDADLVHLHHLSLSVHTFLLRRMLSKKTALVVQHHGGVNPPKWKRHIHNLFNRSADGFFFTTTEQGKEWLLQKNSSPVYPVMEGAAFFNYTDRDHSRTFAYINRDGAGKRTGMDGNPVFLWVGRLDENKDPLTVLDGFEPLFGQYTEAVLYMIYSDDRLYGKVQERINSSGVLRNRVRLLQNIPHAQMQGYYESADYFVLGSHYEGSGYALSEALSCGCIPVVTDIPSFRMMTDEGKLGALWEPGNKNALILALHAVMNKNRPAGGQACIDFFRGHLSFDAIAEKAMLHYQAVMDKRK